MRPTFAALVTDCENKSHVHVLKLELLLVQEDSVETHGDGLRYQDLRHWSARHSLGIVHL